MTGAPDMKCSMMAPRMAGLMCCHSSASFLVTDMKSEPRNTPVTPSTPNSRCANGEVVASDLSRKSTVPSPSTVLPGMNLSVAGLGVGSVWMNMGICPLRSELVEVGIILVDGASRVKMPARRGLPPRLSGGDHVHLDRSEGTYSTPPRPLQEP